MKKVSSVSFASLFAIGFCLALFSFSCGNNSSKTNSNTSAPANIQTAVITPSPCASTGAGQIMKDVTVTEADSIIKADSENPCFTLLDIRSPQEFDAGHLQGAMVIDFRDSTFSAKLDQLDKNRTYLIYCRTGHRTTQSLPMFKDKGFTTVYNMTGGITQWKQDGLTGVIDAKGNPGDVITVAAPEAAAPAATPATPAAAAPAQQTPAAGAH